MTEEKPDTERIPEPEEEAAATSERVEEKTEKAEESEEPREPEDKYDKENVDPDELRITAEDLSRLLGPRLSRQMFAAITATGASMYGNDNVQNNFSLGGKRPTLTPPANIDSVKQCYAPARADEELKNLLGQQATVCLTGPDGTGRFTTACKALLRLEGIEVVTEIRVPLDQSVADAVHEESRLPARNGYLLHIRDEDPATIVRLLDGRVRAAGSKLVLIRDRPEGAIVRGDAEVDHVAPSPRQVFRAHALRLADLARGDLEDYLHAVDSGAHLPAAPGEVVSLVHQVLSMPSDEVKEFLSEHNSAKLREEAVGYLEVGDTNGPPGRRRLRQHRRAFRIAYAASTDQPIGQVFAATGLLLARLDAESGWDDLGRTALEHSTTALLGRWPGERRVWNRATGLDDGLIDAVFDVTWHEFDHTRPALIAWLNDLVNRNQFVDTAIYAVTKLAIADFDEVFPAFIDVWSRSQRIRERRAAAQLAVILASVPALRDRMLRAVHHWVASATKARHDTVASAYASGLRQNDASWDLADLRTVAGGSAQMWSWTIAEAIRQLVKDAPPELVVGALADWIRGDSDPRLVTRHAARALVRMADVRTGGRWNSPPLLLAGLADGAIPVADLGPLWYAALLGESTKALAWIEFDNWLGYAHRNHELRAPVAALITEMAGKAPPLRRRLRSYLDLPEAPDWITVLIGEWEP